MKNKYILLFLIGLFIPSLVFAHEANTKVEVDVFYKEKDDSYNTLMTALTELSMEEETMGKFEVTIYPYTDTLCQKVYKYASYENSTELLVFTGNKITFGFSNRKYIQGTIDSVSSLYTYYKNDIKKDIISEYKSTYTSIVDEIREGYYDSYLEDSTSDNIFDKPETNDNEYDDNYGYEEFKRLINEGKEAIKSDKNMRNIFYPLIFIVLFSIATSTLKNSIHKNK